MAGAMPYATPRGTVHNCRGGSDTRIDLVTRISVPELSQSENVGANRDRNLYSGQRGSTKREEDEEDEEEEEDERVALFHA